MFQLATKLKKNTSATIGFARGRRDPAERQPLTAAVDTGRVEELGRDRGRVVDVGEVDAEGEERERQDHREDAADQVDGVELQEDRQDERRRRT